ncbi:ABC transporter substrate-binding protein [Bacillus sp. 2205SS5-2]|uniref:ABC transporter substrate-binding protein n=1 Tax=Bacillus sp. 2205SS5-2 TaxID=3109031 RepID=UPI00300544C9
MSLDLSYFQLRANLYPREEKQAVKFKLSELEPIWFCNRKNVKIKLRKLEGERKFIYEPGRGRGHLSKLNFFSSFQKDVEEFVQLCLKQERLEDIVQLMQLPLPLSWIAKVSIEVQKLFGFQSINQEKDILRTMVPRKVTTLDPLYSSINFDNYLIQQLGDTLVRYDPRMESILPHLAFHWKEEENSTKWTFYLRKGVYFHHQRTLTSEDVKYTFERFQQADSHLDWLVENILSIECVSPYILLIKLEKPNPFFLRYMSSANLSILPKDEPVEDNKWIGTGPFQLKKCTDRIVVLEAFDHYFLERPFLDEIEFYLVPSETPDAMNYLIKGKEEPNSVLQKEDVISGFRFIAFNFQRQSIVHKYLFRTALYHVLDVQKMKEDLGREDILEASSFFPYKSKPQRKERQLIPKLLANAGYQGEMLTFYAANFSHLKDKVEWFVKEASEFGIHLKLVYFDMSEYYSKAIDENADLLMMGEVSSVDPHLSFLDAFYNKALIFRRFFLEKDLQYIEECLNQFKYESDRDKREAWIEKVEHYLRENYLILFQQHQIKQRSFHEKIQDVRFDSYGYDDFRNSWID